MRIFFCRSPKISKKNTSSCIATFGIFDGIHQGHIYLLKKLIAQAKTRKLKSLLINFSPHPLSFYKKKFLGYLTTDEEKIALLRGLSLDYFWIIKFDRRIAKMEGEQFIEYILKYFRIRKIIVGEDLKFGYKRRGNIEDLRKICKERDIKFQVIKKKKIEGHFVSSSLIRSLIRKAQFNLVEKFLGRPYSFRGEVLKGRKLGTKILTFPTLNINPKDKVLPPLGVYITLTKYKGRFYQSVTNLGEAPTFKKGRILLETHIINFNKNIYKDIIEVIFIKKIREEKEFLSPFQLKQQILKDIESAKKFFSSHNIL